MFNKIRYKIVLLILVLFLTITTQSVFSQTTQSDEPPRIFYYASMSDFTVVAVLDKREFVGKAEKRKKSDLSDIVAGWVYSFRVEKKLCSKQLFSAENTSQTDTLQNFQIFVPVGTQGENYQQGERYLIFLRQIPVEENLASIYELDKNKIYFRPFEGDKSIFPNETEGFHSPPKKGIIGMSDSKYQDLITNINLFCSTLNEPDIETRFIKLEKLTESTDEELRNNAIYAIEVLKDLEKQRRK